MTDNEINQAVAEACGWHLEFGPRIDSHGSYDGTGPKTMKWIGPDNSYLHSWVQTKDVADKRLPNYVADLNAMHEAEMSLSDEEYMRWSHELIKIRNEPCMPVCRCNSARARERAMAFLRLKGKWPSDERVK